MLATAMLVNSEQVFKQALKQGAIYSPEELAAASGA